MFDDMTLTQTQLEMGDAVIDSIYAMDGSATLSEAADKLEELATNLRELEELGWQLTGPVEDEFGYVFKEGVINLDLDDEFEDD